MTEAIQKAASLKKEEGVKKKLHILLEGSLITTEGPWQWTLLTDEIFCSDVFFSPSSGFAESSKCLLHPDDVSAVKEAFAAVPALPLQLSFRVITSWGKVEPVKVTGDVDVTVTPDFFAMSSQAETADFYQQRQLETEYSQQQLAIKAYQYTEQLTRKGIWYLNAVTYEAFYSDNVYRLFGLSPQSLNAHLHTFSPFLHDDDKETVTGALERAWQKEVPVQISYRVVVQEKIKHLSQTVRWVYSEKGERVITGFIEDITESHLYENNLNVLQDELLLKNKALQQAESQSKTANWSLNLLTRQFQYSENLHRIYGVKSSIALTLGFLQGFVHPEDEEKMAEVKQKLTLAQELPLTSFRINRADGKLRYLQQQARLVINSQNEMMVVATVQDITEATHREMKIERLQQTALLHQATITEVEAFTQTAYWLWNIASGETTWSAGMYPILGYKSSNVLLSQKLLLHFIHPDDKKLFSSGVNKVLNSGMETSLTLRIIRKSEVRNISVKFSMMGENGGQFFIGVLQDITVQEEARHGLAAQKRLTEILSSATPDRVIIIDTENTITHWNTKSEEAFNLKKEKVQGKNLFSVFPQLKRPDILEHIHAALSGETVVEPERKSVINNDYVSLTYKPYVNETGEVAGVVIRIHDLTREHELRQQLTQRIYFIEKLLEATVDRIIALDKNMNYLYWNKRAEDYYGMKKEEVVGRNILEISPAFIDDPNYPEFRRALQGEVVHIDAGKHLEAKKGYFETYLIPIKDATNAVSGILWIVHDLNREFSLQRSRQKNMQLLDALNEAYLELDADYKIVYGNATAESFFHLPKKELTGLSVWELLPSDRQSPLGNAIVSAMSEGHSTRSDFISPSNGRWVHFSIAPTVDGIALLFYDIQPLKEAREQLELEHRRLKEAEALGRIGNFDWKVGEEYVVWSDELYRINGLEPQSGPMPIEKVDGFLHPDDRPAVTELRAEAVVNPGFYKIVHRIINPDGTLKYVNHQFESVADNEGKVVRVHGSLQDITEPKTAQNNLEKSNEILALTLKSTRAGIGHWNLQTGASDWDDAGKNIIGLLGNEDGTVAEVWLNRIHEEDRPKVIAHAQECARAGKEFWMEYRIVQDSGEVRNILGTGYFRKDEAGVPLEGFGIVIDITGIKKAEQTVKENKDLLQAVFDSSINFVSAFKALRNTAGDIVDFEYLLTDEKTKERAGDAGLLGQKLCTVFPGSKSSGFFKKMVKTVEENCIQDFEQHYMQDGLDNWFRNVMIKLNDGLVLTSEDITARKKYEQDLLQAHQRITTIFKAVPLQLGYYKSVRNKDGELIDLSPDTMNAASADKMQIAGDASGQLMSEILPGLLQLPVWQIMKEVIETGEPKRVELNYEFAHGKVWFDVLYTRLEDGIISASLDITERKKSEEETQKNIAILQQTEAMAEIGSWEYDIASGAFAWSEGMCRIFGLPQGSSVKPEVYLDFSMLQDRTVAKRIIKNIKKEYRPFEESMRIVRDGGVRHLKVKSTVVYNQKGEAQKVVGVDLDITGITAAQDKSRESLYWLQQTAKASPDGITVYDLINKRPVYLNDCLANWLETTSEALVEMGVEGRLELVHPDDRLDLLHFMEKVAATGEENILTLEYRLQPPEKEMIWIRNRSKIFERAENGKVTHVLSILQEVTEEKKAESLLKKLNESLTTKNGELAARNEEITNFAFIASHDLREPIRKLHTFSDWLMQKEADALSIQGKEFVFKMATSVKRLDSLITDITLLTKLEAIKDRMEEVDLNAVLTEITGELEEEIAETNAVIEGRGLPAIFGHKKQLSLLFKNIISNGIKFQYDDVMPVIEIKASTVKDESNPDRPLLKISFSDNGIGFDQQYTDRIFRVFQRLHSQSQFPGTGIGLAICKKIMDNHGGSIVAQSQPRKGSVFTCYFPQ